jgi:hypothetical protein
MKRIIRSIYVISIVIITGFAGCGDDLISDVKDFVPNKPPEITSFTTDIVAGTEVLPNMPVNLTVEANDRDNDEIEYGFSSAYGTFRKLVSTATGCTIQFFISSTCSSSQSIPITVTASDARNGSASMTIDIGDSRVEPVITASWPASVTLSSSGTYSLTFSVDCSGYYQFRTASSDTVTLAFDKSLACYQYMHTDPLDLLSPFPVLSLNIHADAGTNDSENYYLTTAIGEKKVFILFYDNFQRQAEASAVFTITP